LTSVPDAWVSGESNTQDAVSPMTSLETIGSVLYRRKPASGPPRPRDASLTCSA